MEIRERLKQLIMKLGHNPKSFADKIGVDNSAIYRIVDDDDAKRQYMPSSPTLIKIADTFPEVNCRWLLTGQGSMFETPCNIAEQKGESEMETRLLDIIQTHTQTADNLREVINELRNRIRVLEARAD